MALNIGPWPALFDLEAAVVDDDRDCAAGPEVFVLEAIGSFFVSAFAGAAPEVGDGSFAGVVLLSCLVVFECFVFAAEVAADDDDDDVCRGGVRRYYKQNMT